MSIGIERPAVSGQSLERLKPLFGEVRPGPIPFVGDGDQAASEHALDGGGELRPALVWPRHPALDVEALGDTDGLPAPGQELAADQFALGGGQLKVIGHAGPEVIEWLEARRLYHGWASARVRIVFGFWFCRFRPGAPFAAGEGLSVGQGAG